MMNAAFIAAITEELKDLPEELQRKALELVRNIRKQHVKKVPGKNSSGLPVHFPKMTSN